jgi:hypothetical protein
MAKPPQRRKPVRKGTAVPDAELPQHLNYVIMLSGVALAAFGFLVMAGGDMAGPTAVTIAPMILFVAFCVVIPFGIIYIRRKGTPAGQ